MSTFCFLGFVFALLPDNPSSSIMKLTDTRLLLISLPPPPPSPQQPLIPLCLFLFLFTPLSALVFLLFTYMFVCVFLCVDMHISVCKA